MRLPMILQIRMLRQMLNITELLVVEEGEYGVIEKLSSLR